MRTGVVPFADGSTIIGTQGKEPEEHPNSLEFERQGITHQLLNEDVHFRNSWEVQGKEAKGT